MKKAFKYFLKSISNYHRHGHNKNIYLFSTPRSGSTWLMELIASQAGIKFYDEPFNIRRDNVKKVKLFKDWDDLMPDGNNEHIIISYLSDLESNRYKFMNPPPFRRNYKLFTSRIVFKIHVIEHLINTINIRFNGHIVYLLRHPIATTISRHELPRIKYFVNSKKFKEKYLNVEQVEYIEDLYNKGDHFEMGVMSWCFQNLIPLNFLNKKDWLIISYEELLINTSKTCKLLYDRLRLTDFNKLLRQTKKPAINLSISSKDTIKIMNSSSDSSREVDLVTKWKKKITREQEKKAFEILTVFKIDSYKEGRFTVTDKYLNFSDTRILRY